MIDPTLWTFTTATLTDTQAGSGTGPAKGNGGYSSIIITIICTLFAFIFGIICGLVAYGCISALLKRKSQQQSTSLHIQDSAHYDKGASNEASAVYDEVAHNYCETGIPNIRMELNENVAYGHVKV